MIFTYKPVLVLALFFITSTKVRAEEPLEGQITTQESIPLQPETITDQENPQLPKAAPFEQTTPFPPEPEKMSYLRSKINPGKKHQFAARCAAMILGNSYRNRNLKKLRRTINQAINKEYEKQVEKIFTPKAIFLFMINYGFKFSLYLAQMGISMIALSTEAEKISRHLAKINWLELEDDALLLGDIFIGKKLNDWFLPEKDRDLLLAGAGGMVGTLGYILYYKFFFSDMVCLERTLNCFKNNPENFPSAAFMILKKAESLMDKNALDKKTAALVCEQLRDMSRPK